MTPYDAPKPKQKPGYVMFLQWAPTRNAGVNNVVHGLSHASLAYYEPSIVVTSPERPADYNGLWVPLYHLKASRPLGFFVRLLPAMFRLRRILKGAVAANPHFGGLECIPLLVLRWLRLGPPVIMSIHGGDVTEMLETVGIQRRLHRWLFESVDLVVGCSGNLVERFRTLCPAAKTAVVWNATPPQPDVPDRRPMQRSYLLCVAAFVNKKGHDVLLRAFVRIMKEVADLDLVLIGSDGPTRLAIEETVNTLGLASRVHILLNQPNADVWWWMRHAACFVLPSREEPFGIVLLEAGKSKVPIVATRVGGIPEFLTSGEDGLLCDPDCPGQLAEAVLTTLSDRGATARRVAAFYEKANTFTWRATFEAYRSAAKLP